MYFNSPVFLYLFLPIVLLSYHGLSRILPMRWRMHWQNGFILAASIFFYTWGELGYVLLLLASWVGNFILARQIQCRSNAKVWLMFGIFINVGLLFWLKYVNFFLTNWLEIWVNIGGKAYTSHEQHLPIGLSFFTFQAISYLCDVYRRSSFAEESFWRFGVYVFLFPHLIAGPIVRYADLTQQLKSRQIGLDQFTEGIQRFLIGLAKKVILADAFAQVADQFFGSTANPIDALQFSTAAAWFGVLCYSLQIYFDFSGYSDMAIGLGKMFGFDFHENFRYPYTARSISDFWRRWHISLSSWFRDYVYIPLGGNRGSAIKTYRNLLIVFCLCGFWHGANWTFLAWGLFHGIWLVLERIGISQWLYRLPTLLQHFYTLILVMLGWVLFRVESLPQAGLIFQSLLGMGSQAIWLLDLWQPQLVLILPIGIFACGPTRILLQSLVDRFSWLTPTHFYQPIATAILWVVISLQMAASSYSPFIYFRF